MIRNHKSIICILVFLGCLVFFYGKILLIDFIFYTGNEKWANYLGVYEKEISYNSSLSLSQSGHLAKGAKMLEPLLNSPIYNKESNIYELYGDILVTSSGKIDDVLAYYKLALSYGNRNRITEKIRILENPQNVKKQEEKEEIKEEKMVPKDSEFTKEEKDIIEKKKEEIMKSETDRSRYLSPTTPQMQQNVIRETIDFLDTGKEIADW